MNPSQKQAIEQEATKRYIPIKHHPQFTYAQIEAFEEGATFGLSLQANEWVSVSDRLPTKDDADESGRIEAWGIFEGYPIVTTIDNLQLSVNVLRWVKYSHWRKIVKPD